MLYLEVGDIILYQEGYYGVQSTVANQYWGGKNPHTQIMIRWIPTLKSRFRKFGR